MNGFRLWMYVGPTKVGKNSQLAAVIGTAPHHPSGNVGKSQQKAIRVDSINGFIHLVLLMFQNVDEVGMYCLIYPPLN